MKKETARSLRLTSEALTALKTLAAETPGCSQGDVVSKALVAHASKASLAPVIQFGVLDSQQLPFIQLEATMAERRLRELKQQGLRVRPQDKTQAEKLSAVLSKVEIELGEYIKFRLALAELGRLGNELKAEDQGKVRTLIRWLLARIKKLDKAEHKSLYELELRILKAFLPE